MVQGLRVKDVVFGAGGLRDVGWGFRAWGLEVLRFWAYGRVPDPGGQEY